MAKIRPFSGLRYDLSRAGDPTQLLAPPYDVVDAAGRAEIGARSPHNCIHVILPEGDGDARYARGASEFRRLCDEALTRDGEASLYVYHQTFEAGGKTFTRKGFVTLVELTTFGNGPVLAHERTLAGPREDRLKLMRACDAHLELVFGLFSDPACAVEGALAPALGEAVLACNLDGVRHELFRVADPAVIDRVQALLADKNIYIADGHHRYTTMTTFREELEARGRAGAAYGIIYLSNLDDDGLVVLPTHRIVHSLAALDLDALLQTLAPHFDLRTEPLGDDVEGVLARLRAAGAERAAFGLARPGGELHIAVLKADFDPHAAGLGQLPAALQTLDVSVLHELVLERGLGITKEAQSNKTNLRYYKSSTAAFDLANDAATAGDAQLVCFMNATPVKDVVEVCEGGEVMPQKSTFFFPKIPTGLVFHDLKGDAG